MPFAIVLQPHGVIVHGEHVVRTGEYVAGIDREGVQLGCLEHVQHPSDLMGGLPVQIIRNTILRTAGSACRDGQQCDPARHQDHTGDGELHHVTTTP